MAFSTIGQCRAKGPATMSNNGCKGTTWEKWESSTSMRSLFSDLGGNHGHHAGPANYLQKPGSS